MTGKRPLKKRSIDQAAMEIFAQQGYAGATIKEIAAKAGVTEGAIYRHYASKEEMALSLFTEEMADISDQLSQALKSPLSPAKKLRTIIGNLYQAYQNEPWPLLFVILNFQNLQGQSGLDNKKHIYDFVVDCVRELFPHSDAQRDYEFFATMVTGLVIQPIIFHYYQRLTKHPLDYLDDITHSSCLLLGLACE